MLRNYCKIKNMNSKTIFIDICGFINFFREAIILDCRLLKEYEKRKIENSIHIACHDHITKKRLSTNKLSVKDLICREEVRNRLEKYRNIDNNDKILSKSNMIIIVLYDDSTNDENDLNSSQNLLQLVFDNIRNTLINVNCKILKGKQNENFHHIKER